MYSYEHGRWNLKMSSAAFGRNVAAWPRVGRGFAMGATTVRDAPEARSQAPGGGSGVHGISSSRQGVRDGSPRSYSRRFPAINCTRSLRPACAAIEMTSRCHDAASA